ncbi:hypothetical protein, partial [Parabacteroides gordonii]|uniref:hypothetical protein n=1 Tax=Parabacteroides gordonii TaxID=574930 RepID=UPI00241F84E2
NGDNQQREDNSSLAGGTTENQAVTYRSNCFFHLYKFTTPFIFTSILTPYKNMCSDTSLTDNTCKPRLQTK